MITPVMSNWYILYISRPAVESLSFQKISTSYHTTSSSNLLLMLEIQIGFLAGLDLIHQEGHHNPLERTYGFRSIQVATTLGEEDGLLMTLRRILVSVKRPTGNSSMPLLKLEVPSFTKNMHVRTPTNPLEAEHHMFEMTQAGFPGCLGSTDATHVSIERCFNRLWNQHISSKLPCTARTYNATVNHRWRILSSTTGHPC